MIKETTAPEEIPENLEVVEETAEYPVEETTEKNESELADETEEESASEDIEADEE